MLIQHKTNLMRVASTEPPAKLNLFLEIPSRRNDGFHEIDTVMTAISLRDELTVELIDTPGIDLTTHWLPSRDAIAAELGLGSSADDRCGLLEIPNDDSNLVVKALQRFRQQFSISNGFRVRLGKRIPAGAGLGGASSDAAHAISCAAQLCQIDNERTQLHTIAASVGSDVAFFLPEGEAQVSAYAAHAGGRGELITPLTKRTGIHFVVAYPPHRLSTAKVYGALQVSPQPVSSKRFIDAWERGDEQAVLKAMMNRLSEPASKILPQLHDLIESLWQSGLQPCQLTGSGSACFGIARDADHAFDALKRLESQLQPGVLLRVAHTIPAAAPIKITPT